MPKFSPKAFPDWQCEVIALEIERSFWEKATILHSEYYRPSDKSLPDRYSQHYADTAMLMNHPKVIQAINQHDLRNQVILWKSQFFGSSWASYDLAKPGTFRLIPKADRLSTLRRDYVLMRDMYLSEPVPFDDIITTLSNLEHLINISLLNGEKIELSMNNKTGLLSLGEALTKKRGDDLFQSIIEILAAGANINDNSLNGHRPLQLLIKANLEQGKKLGLVKSMIDLGADIHSPDTSGLTPYQVAISEGNKSISDLLHAKGALPISPPGIGYAQHYKMYRKIPLP